MMDIANQEEIKFLTFDVVLNRFYGERFDMTNAKTDIPNPLKVYSDDGRVIGSAVATYQSGTLSAQISLLYDCPERLDIENDEMVYAIPVGAIVFDAWDTDDMRLEKVTSIHPRPKVRSIHLKKIIISKTAEIGTEDRLIWGPDWKK